MKLVEAYWNRGGLLFCIFWGCYYMAYILLIVYFGILRLWFPKCPRWQQCPSRSWRAGVCWRLRAHFGPIPLRLALRGCWLAARRHENLESNSFPDYIAPVGKFMKIEFLDPFDSWSPDVKQLEHVPLLVWFHLDGYWHDLWPRIREPSPLPVGSAGA